MNFAELRFWEYLLAGLALLLGRDPRCVLGLPPQRPSEPAMLVGDSHKLQALGWQPRFTLSQGLEQTLRDLSTAGSSLEVANP